MGDNYISREDVMNAFESASFNCFDDYVKALVLVGNIPSADVAPVVHGHWIPYRCDMYECSVCQCIYTSFDSEKCDADYCPHCGSFNGGKNEV